MGSRGGEGRGKKPPKRRAKARPKPRRESAKAPPPAPAAEPPDPGACFHHALERLGIQEIGVWPYRVHLVVCRDCGSTQTTESLRALRRAEIKGTRRP